MKKTCGGCSRSLPVRKFSRKGKGYQHRCKECERTRLAELRKTPEYRVKLALYASGHRLRKAGKRERAEKIISTAAMRTAENYFWGKRGIGPMPTTTAGVLV